MIHKKQIYYASRSLSKWLGVGRRNLFACMSQSLYSSEWCNHSCKVPHPHAPFHPGQSPWTRSSVSCLLNAETDGGKLHNHVFKIFQTFHVLLALIIRTKTGRYIDVTAVPSRHFFHVLLGYRRASAQRRHFVSLLKSFQQMVHIYGMYRWGWSEQTRCANCAFGGSHSTHRTSFTRRN